MGRILKFAAAVLAGIAAVVDAGEVVTLTATNFDEALAAAPLMMVEFYAPWCGHCKALAPEYDAAAKELPEGQLAKVDCTAEQALCQKFEVRGYPTVKVFHNQSPSDYEGPRKADGIVQYMKKQAKPAIINLESAEAITAAAEDKLFFVGFFTDAEDIAQFTGTANKLRNSYSFGLVTDAAVAKAAGVTAPAVKLYKKFDDPTAELKFDGKFDEKVFGDFAKAESFPLIGKLGPENYRQYLERALPLVNIFTDPNSEADKELIAKLGAFAKNFKGKLSICEIDGVMYARHAQSLGLPGKTPSAVIQDLSNQSKYLFPVDQAVTAEGLSQLMDDFLGGKLEPFLKSQPVPENNEGPLVTIVGKNFNDVVINNEKDVLVEFYAPWCGHCKELAPKYEALAQQFSNNANVVVGMIDATENDVTAVEVQGFPTIYLFPAGDKSNPIQYNGDRTTEAMAKFIQTNGKAKKAEGEAHEL